MDISKYRDIFFTESREYLTQLNTVLVQYEKDGNFRSAVDELFRSVHTLKGMASAMGYEQIADLSHELENFLDSMRDHNPGSKDTDLLFQAFDALEQLVNAQERDDEELDVAEILEAVRSRLQEGVSGQASQSVARNSEPIQVALVEDGIPAYRVKVRLDQECVFKVARAMVVIGTLDSVGRVLACDPEVAEKAESTFDGMFDVYLQCSEVQSKIEEMVRQMPEVMAVEVLPFSPDMDRKQLDPKPAALKRERQAASLGMDKALAVSETVRVNVAHLEAMMNACETLVMDRAALARLSEAIRDKDLDRLVGALTRNLSDLQHEVLQARMVPAAEILDRFPRMVRDLAKELGREVDLVCTGRDTEFDRSLLEHLGDPLVHLLRNAVDHGIESTEERIASGKPRRGTLTISVNRDRDNVVFMVEDDGKGINKDAVLRKALDSGLIDQDEVEAADFDDTLELIMRPGFSTATSVSKVSGRGVGLDVVRHSVRSLGGALDVESAPGSGTRCTMRLPITLAIIKALLVQVGEEEYAIPTGHVFEVMAVPESDMNLVNRQWVLAREQGVLPLVIMRDALEVAGEKVRDGRPKTVVVVSVGSRRSGLVFDRLLEQQDIVVKGLGDLLRPVEGFTGVTIGGDGRPILILDVTSFV